MSGTPGAVSLSSVCERLFSIPNHATSRWKGMKSARNRWLPGEVSSARAKPMTAFSYASLGLIHELTTLASRTTLIR